MITILQTGVVFNGQLSMTQREGQLLGAVVRQSLRSTNVKTSEELPETRQEEEA